MTRETRNKLKERLGEGREIGIETRRGLGRVNGNNGKVKKEGKKD